MAVFLERLPFWGLKGVEVSCIGKIKLDRKSKQRLRGSARNDLTHWDKTSGYQLLQNLEFFIVLATFPLGLPFWGLKDIELSCLSKISLDAKWKQRLSSA